MTTQLYFPPTLNNNDAGAVLVIKDACDGATIDRIEAQYRDLALGLEQARLYTGAVDPDQRNCRIGYIRNDANWGWLYAQMHYYAHLCNTGYRFALWGICEALQFTEYNEGGLFHWHVDDGAPGVISRKLSFTLQLSDPRAYEGGDLEIWGSTRTTCSRERGTLICFPSYTLHRVTPVTRGVRRSLVVWVTGPPFQ